MKYYLGFVLLGVVTLFCYIHPDVGGGAFSFIPSPKNEPYFVPHVINRNTNTVSSSNYIGNDRLSNVLSTVNSRLKYGGGGHLINYSSYHIGDKGRGITCVDYSFATAVLYGTEAEVGYNSTHAFVIVDGKIIEPQRTDGSLFSSSDYSIKFRISSFKEEDIKTIKKFFE
jgi:hypothetical protein